MRKRHDKAEKAKVAIEALKGEQTVQEIAMKYGVHPNMVARWKQQLVDGAMRVFDNNGENDQKATEIEAERDNLLRQIGQLTVVNEFLKKKYRQVVRERALMIEPEHSELTITEQCGILSISRSSCYYQSRCSNEDRELEILMAILEELKTRPFYGYRKVAYALQNMQVSRKQVRRIMKKAGLRAIYPGKRTSQPGKGHKKYPYLLKGKKIWLSNQVWSTDITYIRLGGGYVYLVVIMDLYSR
jgi:putative transposase